MENFHDYDVIIVGAGPVGLSLALALARDHHKVLLLEKNADVHEHSRAPAIWPRTQEILSDLGVIERFLSEGIIHEQLTVWDGDKDPPAPLITFPLKEISDITDFTQLLILPQSKTERFLLEEINSNYPNVSIHFDALVTSVSQNSESVTVSAQKKREKVEATAPFLVGCDGAHSQVRESLGFSLHGQTYPLLAALADVKISFSGQKFGSPLITTKGILCIAIEIEKGVWRLILPYQKNDNLPLDKRIQRAVPALFKLEDYEVIWKSEFHLHRRISTGLQKGRVVLAGDAAHLNSPVGGQGMNSGIQDIEKLRISLDDAIGKKSILPLAKYAENREKAVGQVNKFTNTMTKIVLFGKNGYIKVIIKILGVIIKIKPIRRRILLKVSMFR